RALAHGVRAQRRVADVACVVDTLRPAGDGIEILRVRLPRPLDPRLHRLGGNVLGALEIAHAAGLLVRPARAGRGARVGPADPCHAVPAGAGAERIPRDLRVHVGVAVDEAWRHDMMARIDFLAPALADVPDARDPVTADSDIGAVPREPGAIDHGATADHEVVGHVYLPAVRAASMP